MKEAMIGIYEQAIELMGKIPEEWIVGFCVIPPVLLSLYWFISGCIGVAKAAERGEIEVGIIWWW